MIVVVADTSPLNYLIQIHCEHILPALYIRVFVPTAVVEELDHPRTVGAVREWLAQVPSWLIVRDVASEANPALAKLDPGERQAIQLAKQEHADLLRWTKSWAFELHVNKGWPLRELWVFWCTPPDAA